MSAKSHRAGRIELDLRDIVRHADRIASLLRGRDKEAYLQDEAALMATYWCLTVIGEASRRVERANPGLSSTHPELELAVAAAAQNRIVHGYDTISDAQVYRTATVDVPRQRAAVARYLASLSEPD